MSGGLAQLQRRFAAHLRDPDNQTPLPGIPERRLAVYRELFINNVNSLLSGSFPVLQKILGRERWSTLVREFYAQHHAKTPYFLELPGEFVDWLQSRPARAGEPAFIAELARHEWIELALTVAADPAWPQADPLGDLIDGRPVLAPLVDVAAYLWPVHRLAPDFQPAIAPSERTCILAWRDRNDDVHFMNLGVATARLLEILQENPSLTGREAIDTLANELGSAQPDVVIAARDMLEDLRKLGVLLGSVRC
ncbi:MAG: putative DNA-binding domain-containing protein [Steroidobacteraceae bacterium]